MGLEFEQSTSFDNKLKNADWKKIGLHHALPILVSFVLGGVLLGVRGGSDTPSYSTETILSDVDLPSQISKLQNSQITVLESQLKRLGEEINLNDDKGVYGREEKASLVLSTLNYDNNLTNFFKTLLSFDSNSTAESQYSSLVNFLENPLTEGAVGDDQLAVQEKESMLAFLKSQSWARETNSRVSIAGNVIPALLTGSTDDNKLYLVIVPATNEKREFKNLSYVVSLGKENKVRKLVYQGEIENNADLETWFKGLEAVVSDNVGEFIYLQQPSYEERKAKENLAFLERIKTAFGLENDGDRKVIRLEGANVIVGELKERNVQQRLLEDFKLSEEQVTVIMSAVVQAVEENKKLAEQKEASTQSEEGQSKEKEEQPVENSENKEGQ